jgi:hypothetical protein
MNIIQKKGCPFETPSIYYCIRDTC